MPHASSHPASPWAAVRGLWHHRQLAYSMARREVVGRYRGSALGLLWSFFNPLLMLAAYTFVFSGVFQARWAGNAGAEPAEFALILFAGMIVHGLFAENLTRAPLLVLGNPGYVKKVVFPLEILPWVSLGAALFHAGISFLVLAAAQLAIHHSLPWTIILLPLVLAPYLLLILGVSWFLAATGVYLRDLAQATGIVATLLLFLSPVFYPVSALPAAYQPLLLANPLTFIIEQTRLLVIWGQLPDWQGLALYLAAGAGVAWLGFAWFQKTRKGFADVL